MKYVVSLYVTMALIVFVNLTSEFILNGEYAGLASWISVGLFLLGTVFFANARYFLSKNNRSSH